MKTKQQQKDKYNKNIFTLYLPPASVPSLLPFTAKLIEQVNLYSLFPIHHLPLQPDPPPRDTTKTTFAKVSRSLHGARFNDLLNALPLFDPSAAFAS